MPITDTSWLFALLDELDVHHGEAVEQAKKTDRLVVPASVLAELLQLVYYRVRKQSGESEAHRTARQALRDLETTPSVVQLETHDARAVSAIFHRHATLSYVDAVAIAHALRGHDLLTFDQAQRTALVKERKR